jgi:uncharacterized phage-associated protein
MVSCLDVSNLFLAWANREGEVITNLKMQKLLYYAQAWHLVHFKKPLFPETIEAWDFGPVVPSAYHNYKDFGCSPIAYKATGKEENSFTKNQIEYLTVFYDKFIKFSPHELVNMSHNEIPWKSAFKKLSITKIISHDVMKRYYENLLLNKKKSS